MGNPLYERLVSNNRVKNLLKAYNKAASYINFQDNLSFETNKRLYFILFFLVLIATLSLFFLSVSVRQEQYKKWQDNEDYFFYKEDNRTIPMMTTLDAYKFIRHADEYAKGIYDTSKEDPMIFYPKGSPYPDPVPLLSVILYHASKITGEDLFNTAVRILPYLSSFFIIAVAIYFFLAGYSGMGLLAAIITTFSFVFFYRSGVARFDTDGMNFFFLWSAALFTFLASYHIPNLNISDKRKEISIYIASALLGLTIFLFFRFYHHGMFNIAYLFILPISLFLANIRWKVILIATGIYFILSSPIYMFRAFYQTAHAINTYIFKEKVGIHVIFPNVYETISEAAGMPLLELFEYIISSPFLVALGLIGCLTFIIFNIRKALPFIPIIILGLLAFFSAGRFAMFLSGLVGVGLSYLIYIIFGYLFKYIRFNKLKEGSLLFFKSLLPFIASIILIIILFNSNLMANKGLPGPSIAPIVYKQFVDMEKLPEGSAVYSWWDFGLPIAAHGVRVFHSGMTQETPATWLIALSLVSNMEDMHKIISYMDHYGIEELEELAESKLDNALKQHKGKLSKKSKEFEEVKTKILTELKEHILSFEEPTLNKNIYVLYTPDMVDKFGAFNFLSTAPVEFFKLQCLLDADNEVVAASRSIGADLKSGKLKLGANEVQLADSIISLADKRVQKTHSLTGSHYLIVEPEGIAGKGKNLFASSCYILDRAAYNSSFVQMYMLQRADERYFEEVWNRFPFGMLYKVK